MKTEHIQTQQNKGGRLYILYIKSDNFDDIALAIAEGILDTLEESGEISSDSSLPHYAVQTGAFRSERYARRLLNELTEMNFPAVLTEGDGLFRVTVGEYDTLDEAVKMERRLKRAGYQTVIVTIQLQDLDSDYYMSVKTFSKTERTLDFFN